MRFKFASILLIVLLLFACSSNNMNRMSAKEKWDKAEQFFSQKKYHKAALLYEQIVLERNSSYTADSQYKLAESYYLQEKYAEAITEYQLLQSLFPDYKNIASAQFMIGVCNYHLALSPHYTQDESNKSIEAMQIFIDKYPNDTRINEAYQYIQKSQQKLIEKKYLAGYIYYKIDDYSSAILYFNEIIALNNKDDLELKSLYYCGKIFYEREDLDNLLFIQEKLRESFPESKELKSIIKKTVKLSKKLKINE